VTRLRYKFVELSTVTDERLEDVVNEWVARGWLLDGIRFAMAEASRRPAMAFVSFVREEPVAPGPADHEPAGDDDGPRSAA
jgi:hypothetical protein